MSLGNFHLDRFLCRVHRRGVALCLLEQMGVGMAIGCGIAISLVPFLIWRDQAALPLTALLFGAGALAGLMWGIMHQPTLLKTAMEADRQLNLDDLLGTALMLRNQSSDDIDPDWAGTVLAMAEVRCQSISPSQIILRRLGIRAWSGIGLAAALALTLGILSSNPQITEAEAGEKVFLSPGELAREIDRNQKLEERSVALEFRQGIRRNNPRDPANSEETDIPDQSQTTSHSANHREAPDVNASAPSANGTGGGIARSPAPQTEALPMRDAAANNTQSHAKGVAGGGGRASEGLEPIDRSASSAMTGGSSPATHAAEDWDAKGNTGPGDNITSNEAAVPDGFRDLVREYFRTEDQ